MDPRGAGKWLMIVGAVVFVVGLLIVWLGRIPWIGRLPGDILIKREHMTFYFPVVSCIVVSIVLTLLLRLFGPR